MKEDGYVLEVLDDRDRAFDVIALAESQIERVSVIVS